VSSLLQTEFPFTLPRGFVDADGNRHREGVMRLATAADEIAPLKDPRVQANPAYLVVIVLSRVITSLGSVSDVNPQIVERFFASDLAYLQEFYNRINSDGTATVKAVCPRCEHAFEVEADRLGGD
jgi:hypothetical protein